MTPEQKQKIRQILRTPSLWDQADQILDEIEKVLVHEPEPEPEEQMLFEYYEIRACVDFGDEVVSYVGNPCINSYGDVRFTWWEALAQAQYEAGPRGGEVFWTLYGRDQLGQAQAIGDFKTFKAALQTLQAILVPFRRAEVADDWSIVDDILNQSTTEERL